MNKTKASYEVKNLLFDIKVRTAKGLNGRIGYKFLKLDYIRQWILNIFKHKFIDRSLLII